MTDLSRRKILEGLGIAGINMLGERSAFGAVPARGSRSAPSPSSDTSVSRSAPLLSPSTRKETAVRILKYLKSVGPELLRPPKGILKYPSISPSLPGASYSTQLWDWDTLWTGRALFRLANLLSDSDLHSRVSYHVQGSVLNFLDHQAPDGRIPIMISESKVDPLGCLKPVSPDYHNQAKPVMAQLALLVADETGDAKWLSPVFDRLLLFIDSWKVGNESQIGLLVWGDDIGIGDDNDPTTYGRPFFSSANLLLNCLYYQELLAAEALANRLGRDHDCQRLKTRASDVGKLIQKYCWDQRDQFYYTVDVQCRDHRSELLPNMPPGMPMSWKCLPLRIQMFTGFLPLWCKLATQEQAFALVGKHYRNPQTFNSDFGVRSLSKQEAMYSLAASSNPSNWLGPIWIIVNYLVWCGLRNYGFHKEAEELSSKTLTLLANDLLSSGSFNEYYDPDSGRPLSHKGFLDWDMLVLEMI